VTVYTAIDHIYDSHSYYHWKECYHIYYVFYIKKSYHKRKGVVRNILDHKHVIYDHRKKQNYSLTHTANSQK